MKSTYDKHYTTENLFGAPYPELVDFFAQHPVRGKVLDLGCGQGRDAIALARLGYTVTGVDNSAVGIVQMRRVAQAEKLDLAGLVADLYTFDDYRGYDFVLLDSMFHFGKKEKAREMGLIKSIVSKIKNGCRVIVCLQDTGNKVAVLNQAFDLAGPLNRVLDVKFNYTFGEGDTGHQSASDYRMVVVEK